MGAFFERHRTIKFEVALNEGVEVIWSRWIGLNMVDTRCCKVSAAPCATTRFYRQPSGLVIDNPIANAGLHTTEILARKMIALFR